MADRYSTTTNYTSTTTSYIRKLCSIFESPKHYYHHHHSSNPKPTTNNSTTTTTQKYPPDPPIPSYTPFRLPNTQDRVVIYFTSLHGIRQTFNDCHNTRTIFKSLLVNLDERDVSMDAAYKTELQTVLGEKNISLPQVFIKGKYVGGADVIMQLLEAGELVKLLIGVPLRLGFNKCCEVCNDLRFVPCGTCDGSRKVFDEEDHGGHKRCSVCNENGLVRCVLCCIN